jgi:predicted DCC family thiol-disulfide oxidoreductase YuxK
MNGQATTLIFDGDCGFCTRCVLWGTANLSAFPNPVAFQRIEPSRFGLTENDVRKSVWLISGNTVLSGARAVAWILKGQKSIGWRLLGQFIDWCPIRPFSQLGYRLVAVNRHRLPGASTECKMVNFEQ